MSDPAKRTRLAEIEPVFMMPRRPNGPDEEQAQQEYRELRDDLEDQFVGRLRRGELIATGIPYPPDSRPRREFITQETWELFDADFEESDLYDGSGKVRWTRVEVMAPEPPREPAKTSDHQQPSPPPIRPIRFAVDRANEQIVFSVGPVLAGASYKLFTHLLIEFEADQEKGLSPEKQSFVPAAELAERLGIAEQGMRQAVRRTRDTLFDEFLTFAQVRLTPDEVIENAPGQGYRLNPGLMKVTLAQARADRQGMSRDGV